MGSYSFSTYFQKQFSQVTERIINYAQEFTAVMMLHAHRLAG